MSATLLVSTALLTISLAAPDVIVELVGEANFADMELALAFGVFYTTTPFFLSVLHSPQSFSLMLSSYRSFWFFLPTIVSDFFAYSIARYDDLSWGTKAVGAGGGGAAASGGDPAAAVTSHRATAPLPAPAAALSAVAAWATGATERLQLRDMADARESTWRTTNALTLLQLVAFVGVIAGALLLSDMIAHFLLIVGVAMASVGALIMLLSMAYFAPNALCKRSAGSIGTRACNATTLFGWVGLAGALAVMFVASTAPHAPLYHWAQVGFYGGYGALIAMAALRYASGACVTACCCNERPRQQRQHRQLPPRYLN